MTDSVSKIQGPGALLPASPETHEAPQPKVPFDRALDRFLRESDQERRVEDTAVAEESGKSSAFKKDGAVNFSRHAKARLESRNIDLTEADMQRLESAIDQLNERGSKESLVLMEERAYIVGVPKRTVITVMERQEALGTIFTNIDSTFVVS